MPSEKLPGKAVLYADFRQVNRLTLPFKVTTIIPGAQIVTHRSEIKLNENLTNVRFAPPADFAEQADAIDALLSNYVRAIGGREAAQKAGTRVTTFRIEDQVSGTVAEGRMSQMTPNLVLIETDVAGIGRELRGFDGTTPWAYSDIEGYHVLQGAELASLLLNTTMTSQVELRRQHPLAKMIGSREIDGRPAIAVALATFVGPGGVYSFDRENSLLLRVEGNLAAGATGAIEATIDYSDYRTVDGVVMPFVITTKNSASHSKITVMAVNHDVPLKQEIFSPRKNGEISRENKTQMDSR